MLYNTAAGISVLSAAGIDRKGGGRALGHWSGWLRQAVDCKWSATNEPNGCLQPLSTEVGSGSRESPAAGWPKGVKFHPSVTVASYATLVCVISIVYSVSVTECIGISFYLVGITYLFQTTQFKQNRMFISISTRTWVAIARAKYLLKHTND